MHGRPPASTLRVLQSLMLAQAQRCYYERAVMDAISPKLLFKLAQQLQLLYSDAEHKLRAPPLHGHLPRMWPDVAGCNALLFEAEANFHAAECDAAEYRYGAQVSRLTRAFTRNRRVRALRPGRTDHPACTVRRGTRQDAPAHEVAYRDNDVVCRRPYPTFHTLPRLTGQLIVAAITPEELLAPLTADADPFARIIPSSAKASLDECDARARALVREIST